MKKPQSLARQRWARQKLFLAIKKNDGQGLVEALSEGASVKSLDEDVRLPMTLACEWGALECMQSLMERGASLDACDPQHHSPLDAAMMGESAAALNWLLKRGANPNGTGRCAPLITAVALGQVGAIERLIEAGAEVNARVAEGTAARAAAKYRKEACLRALLRAGADPNIQDDEGSTPLMLSAQNNDDGCLIALLTHKARLDDQNRRRQSAAMLAAHAGSDRCLRLLIEAGADLSLRDQDGDDALSMAVGEGRQSCEMSIRQRLASVESAAIQQELNAHPKARSAGPKRV